MVVLVLQILGLILGLVGWILESSSTGSRVWKVRSNMDAVTTYSSQFQGLWLQCTDSGLGSFQCRGYKTVLGLPGYVQGCRALMIISLLLGLIAMILSMLGLKCIRTGTVSESTKGKISLMGGTMFLLSGFSSLIAVSWYTAQIVQDFHQPFNTNNKYELGSGIYMGWLGAFLSILGGAFLCCSCKANSRTSTKTFNYNYANANQAQMIYKSATASDPGNSKVYV